MEKFASFPSALASSCSVSSAAGELLISAVIAALTNAVVAIWVLLSVCAAVGALGVPVKAGLTSGAPPRLARPPAAVGEPVPPLAIGMTVDASLLNELTT